MMCNRWKDLAMAGALVVLSGCMTFEVAGLGSKSTTKSAVTTIHGSFWGIPWQAPLTDRCEGAQLVSVEFHTNPLYVLASVASLGVYVPQDIEVWCAKAKPPEDDDEKDFDPQSKKRKKKKDTPKQLP